MMFCDMDRMDVALPTIRCFLSSRMPVRMQVYRDAALEAVQQLGPLMELWRFQDRSPAAAGPADFFLPAVESCDVLIVVIAHDMSQPTISEVRHAIKCRKDVLAICLRGLTITEDVRRLVLALRSFGVTTAEIDADPGVLRDPLRYSLAGYVVDRLRRAPSTLWRSAHLVELEKAAISRLERGWRATQLSDRLASNLACDDHVGLDDELRELVQQPGLVILVGPLGAGKTTALNRLFLEAVRNAKEDMLAPTPLWIPAREARAGLRSVVDQMLSSHGAIGFIGARVFVDEVDGEDAMTIAALLQDARTIADSITAATVVLAMRSRPDKEHGRVYEATRTYKCAERCASAPNFL